MAEDRRPDLAPTTAEPIDIADWRAEARRRSGDDPMFWTFVCPSCGHIEDAQGWKDVGATPGEIAFSCSGRRRKNPVEMCETDQGQGCNYAGGGLFRINPVAVRHEDGAVVSAFAFADAPKRKAARP